MTKIILCSHGRLCEGLLDTLGVFSLQHDSIIAIPFYCEGIDGEVLLNQVAETFNEEEPVLIFTDLFYGSVNQCIMQKFYHKDNIHIIAGMNLMVVMEFAAMDEPLTEELIEEKVNLCKEALIYTRRMKRNESEEDE